MSPSVAGVLATFESECDRAAARVIAHETAWRRGRATVALLEDGYAATYLRLYDSWIEFLDGLVVRMLCGYTCGSPVVLLKPRCRVIADARAALIRHNRGRPVLYWYEAHVVATRLDYFFDNSHMAAAIRASSARLEAFRAIRHRLGHTRDAKLKRDFDDATLFLAGRAYRGSVAGRFLRDWNKGPTPPERWLESLAEELRRLAKRIAPP